MTWVKICGITNLEDAQIAIDAGADALGFIFYEKSPRRIDPETAKRIVAELPVHIEKVGVFVLQDSESAAQIVEGLTSLQIHVRLPLGVEPNQGSELVAVAAARPRKFYLAMPAAWFLGEGPVTANLSSFIEKRPERPFDRILLD
jgi:phosphoribosylanthranilate isomerase